MTGKTKTAAHQNRKESDFSGAAALASGEADCEAGKMMWKLTTNANCARDSSNGSRLIGRSGLPHHWFAEALSRPSTSIFAVTIFVGQANITKPLATAIFCAPFAV